MQEPRGGDEKQRSEQGGSEQSEVSGSAQGYGRKPVPHGIEQRKQEGSDCAGDEERCRSRLGVKKEGCRKEPRDGNQARSKSDALRGGVVCVGLPPVDCMAIEPGEDCKEDGGRQQRRDGKSGTGPGWDYASRGEEQADQQFFWKGRPEPAKKGRPEPAPRMHTREVNERSRSQHGVSLTRAGGHQGDHKESRGHGGEDRKRQKGAPVTPVEEMPFAEGLKLASEQAIVRVEQTISNVDSPHCQHQQR